MVDFAAPDKYPYVDYPDTDHSLDSEDYNQVIESLVDLGGASGRVASLEADGARTVLVTTGAEARPTASVVLWVAYGGVTPSNALANDIIFSPADGGIRPAARLASGTGAAYNAAVNTGGGATQLFSDDFTRSNGAVGNGWGDPAGNGSTIAISSNTMVFPGPWAAYNRVYQAGLPKNVSVRATFAGTIAAFHGIFLGHSLTTNTGIKLFFNSTTWVVGNSQGSGLNNTNVAFTNTPPTPYTSLRLDFDGTTITCYINGTVVHTTTPATLGITLDTDTGSIYRVGYCGEATSPGLDDFQVWTT